MLPPALSPLAPVQAILLQQPMHFHSSFLFSRLQDGYRRQPVQQLVRSTQTAATVSRAPPDTPYSFNIYTAANITATQFNSCNPGLNCSTLQIGKNVCVSAGTLPSNAPKPNPVCRCPHSQSRRRTKMVPLGWLMYDVHRCTRRFMHLQLFQTYPSIMEWLSQTQVGIPRWLGRKVAMYCGQGGGCKLLH